MKKIIFALSLLLVGAANATVDVGLTGGYFYNASGTKLTSGTIAFVASTTDSVFNQTFAGSTLSENTFLGGDDLILKTFTIASDATTSQFFVLNLSNYTNLTSGDNLAIYWFPSVGVGATVNNGASYGFYTSATPTPDSAQPWAMVSDGGSLTLQFITSSAGGSSIETAGYSNLTAVPEPATTVALLGGAAGLFVMYRRRQRKVVATTSAA